jgi:hypothetical protein
MEVALRRRLEGVATISISQQKQTAEVVFAPGRHVFSPDQFRAAVKEAHVEVISFELDACGRIEQGAITRWFVAGPNRFVVADGSLRGFRTACVSADLADQRDPHELNNIRPFGDPRANVVAVRPTRP